MADRKYEQVFNEQGYKLIAGTDEAGRGPLAGPLVVAAVVFPNDYVNPKINDSKQLSAKKREELYDEIIAHALAYSIVIIDIEEIDRINIYAAARKGMIEAVNSLGIPFDAVLTDAMPLPDFPKPVLSLIHGDALSQTIAGASILAKVTRDAIMMNLDSQYPQYDFKHNMGYGTKKHLEALEKNGITPVHRKTYEPIKSMLSKQMQFEL